DTIPFEHPGSVVEMDHDPRGDVTGQPDAASTAADAAESDDARLTHAAHLDRRVGAQPHSAEHRAVLGVELGVGDAPALTPRQLSQGDRGTYFDGREGAQRFPILYVRATVNMTGSG